MTAFRDQDHSQLAAFKVHISIAESLLDVVADFGAQMRAVANSELYAQRGETWSNLWTQLDQARQIAASLGRDLTAFDASRAEVGDVHLATTGQPITNAMLHATAAAIDTLRAAVPEVVIPRSPNSEYRNPIQYVRARSFKNPAYRRFFWAWVILMIVLVAVMRLADW